RCHRGWPARRGARRLERDRRGRPCTLAARGCTRGAGRGRAAPHRPAFVTRKIALRAAVLVVLGAAVIVGLTVYFSTQTIPPCLRTGVPAWKPPTDTSLHRFELVVPDRAICFFDMDHDHELAGYL